MRGTPQTHMLTAHSPADGTAERKIDPESCNFVYKLHHDRFAVACVTSKQGKTEGSRP